VSRFPSLPFSHKPQSLPVSHSNSNSMAHCSCSCPRLVHRSLPFLLCTPVPLPQDGLVRALHSQSQTQFTQPAETIFVVPVLAPFVPFVASFATRKKPSL
jgi:hypothetical protein